MRKVATIGRLVFLGFLASRAPSEAMAQTPPAPVETTSPIASRLGLNLPSPAQKLDPQGLFDAPAAPDARPIPEVFDQKFFDQVRANQEVWESAPRRAGGTTDAAVTRAAAKKIAPAVRIKEGLARLRDAVLQPSLRGQELVRGGWTEIERKDYASAEGILDTAIALHPWYGEAYLARGFARHCQADLAGAMADYDRAIGLDPDDWRAPTWRAWALLDEGDAWAAIDAYAGVIDRFPEVAAIYATRAAAYLDVQDAAAARADAEKALLIDPEDAPAMKLWIQALDKSGDDATLQIALGELIRREPTNADLYASRALLLATSPDAQLRNPRLALADVSKAEELPQIHARPTLRAKAAAQAALGDYPSAVGSSFRALFSAPFDDVLTDVAHLTAYLGRRPVIKKPWDREPPVRPTHRFRFGVMYYPDGGAFLEVSLQRVYFGRLALLPALPMPIAVVRWSPEGMKEFLVHPGAPLVGEGKVRVKMPR